jgi:hypothetical protein
MGHLAESSAADRIERYVADRPQPVCAGRDRLRPVTTVRRQQLSQSRVN